MTLGDQLDGLAARQRREQRRTGAVGHAHLPRRAVAEVREALTRHVAGVGELGHLGQVVDGHAELLEAGAQRRCVGRADDERQHVDPVAAQLGPEPLAEHEVERLGAAVGGEAPAARPRRARRHQQDAAATARHHLGAVVVRREQRHGAVAPQHPVPLLRGHVEEVGVQRVGARVVDEQPDVEPVGRGEQVGFRAGRREVDAGDARLDAVRSAQLGGERLELVDAARHEHHVDALGRDLAAELGADAHRRAGDHRPRPVLSANSLIALRSPTGAGPSGRGGITWSAKSSRQLHPARAASRP